MSERTKLVVAVGLGLAIALMWGWLMLQPLIEYGGG